MKRLSLCLLLTASISGADPKNAPTQSVEAYSRVYHHKDGTRTETRKDGTKKEIHELTYNEHNVLKCKRIFLTDSKGRTRRGIIYDGRLNPLGSIEFGYDSVTDQLLEERQFNRKAQLVRRLFYPGALDDPRFARRFVAFNYDPDNPDAKPIQAKEEVQPTKPVERDLDNFDPGIPISGRSPAPANAPVTAPSGSPPAAPAGTGTRTRSFLPRRNSR
jgi:hypothetical protein